MPKRIAISSLNASTLDVLNTIRANASYQYQSLVPEISQTTDIPAVGEVLYGYPALANEFINSLVNRIALVRVKSATFNNPYAMLKKGYLEFGETIEEVFVEIAKPIEFSADKAVAREFKRTLPDVRTAFHVMNWRVMYPVTIQDDDLRMAFQSINGVQDLIAKIVESVYKAAQYDEFLLFKYLLIKAISHGKMKPVAVGNTPKDASIAFRSTSNKLMFMSDQYNEAGVHTTTERNEQYIFMDADYNAQFDVEVLASAFNMSKADFMGRLVLIDNWNTFDNARFAEIRENSTQIEDITEDELALMNDVKAVIVDGEWFQVYDNNNKFTEQYVASGLYWNYFYHTWKTVSSSPFSNAVVFVSETAISALPETIDMEVVTKELYKGGVILTLRLPDDTPGVNGKNIKFLQTLQATSAGYAIHPYGVLIIKQEVIEPGTGADGRTTIAFDLDGAYYGMMGPIDPTKLTAGSRYKFSKKG